MCRPGDRDKLWLPLGITDSCETISCACDTSYGMSLNTMTELPFQAYLPKQGPLLLGRSRQ